MKNNSNLDSLIDRAIANDRASLPLQPAAPQADLLRELSLTPAKAALVTSGAAAIPVALKIGLAAIIAAGGVWWTLSRTPEQTATPSITPIVSVPIDSNRKRADSTATTRDSVAAHRSPSVSMQPGVAAPAPFTPSDADLPSPNGNVKTIHKDTGLIDVRVK